MAGRTLVSVAAACFALCPIARIQARAISSFDSNDVTTHSLGIACKLSGANGTITKRGDDECQISDAFLFNAVKIGKKQILPILLASADAANPLLTKFWGHPDPRGKNWQETAVAARQDEYWTYEDNEDPDDIMELASVLEKLRVGSANARSRWQQQSRNVRSDMFSYDMFNTGPNVRIATVQDQKIGENKQGLVRILGIWCSTCADIVAAYKREIRMGFQPDRRCYYRARKYSCARAARSPVSNVLARAYLCYMETFARLELITASSPYQCR